MSVTSLIPIQISRLAILSRDIPGTVADLLITHWNSSSHSGPSHDGETCCRVNLPLVYCKYHTGVGGKRNSIYIFIKAYCYSTAV